ncbi:MAG: hypothetical protein GY845_23695 [Planctomycetes bacterium]|nr:hypothetical protein [Planctomycetota bacterium]
MNPQVIKSKEIYTYTIIAVRAGFVRICGVTKIFRETGSLPASGMVFGKVFSHLSNLPETRPTR